MELLDTIGVLTQPESKKLDVKSEVATPPTARVLNKRNEVGSIVIDKFEHLFYWPFGRKTLLDDEAKAQKLNSAEMCEMHTF